MKPLNFRNRSTEKVSMSVFYVLIGLIVLLFGLFFLVRYRLPFADNPDFNAPYFTGVLLVFLLLMLLGTLGVAVCSLLNSLKRRNRGEKYSNGIPVARLSYGTIGLTAILLGATYLLGSSSALPVNGTLFREAGWLRAADMFIVTSLLLMLVAFAAILAGWWAGYRQRQ